MVLLGVLTNATAQREWFCIAVEQRLNNYILSPYSTKKRVCVGYSLRHLAHEMYMPKANTQRQGPNATYIPLEMGFTLATQCEEI